MKSAFTSRALLAILVTALLAGALYWTVLRDDSTGPTSMAVDLDVSRIENGPAPTHFDTGQQAIIAETPGDPGTKPVVREGKLTFEPTVAGVAAGAYSTPDMGAPVSEIGARWVFIPRGAGPGSISLVVSQGTLDNTPNVVPPVPLQLVVTPINWNLAVKKDDLSALTPIAAGVFDPPLAVDGSTAHEVKVSIEGSVVSLELPQDQRRSVNDARVSQWAGNVATFGLYSNDGLSDSIGGYEKVWASSRAASKRSDG